MNDRQGSHTSQRALSFLILTLAVVVSLSGCNWANLIIPAKPTESYPRHSMSTALNDRLAVVAENVIHQFPAVKYLWFSPTTDGWSSVRSRRGTLLGRNFVFMYAFYIRDLNQCFWWKGSYEQDWNGTEFVGGDVEVGEPKHASVYDQRMRCDLLADNARSDNPSPKGYVPPYAVDFDPSDPGNPPYTTFAENANRDFEPVAGLAWDHPRLYIEAGAGFSLMAMPMGFKCDFCMGGGALHVEGIAGTTLLRNLGREFNFDLTAGYRLALDLNGTGTLMRHQGALQARNKYAAATIGLGPMVAIPTGDTENPSSSRGGFSTSLALEVALHKHFIAGAGATMDVFSLDDQTRKFLTYHAVIKYSLPVF